jgi:hypothetical protein
MRRTMNNEAERIQKKASVPQFKVLPRNMPLESEENDENLSQDSRCANPDLNWARPEYRGFPV